MKEERNETGGFKKWRDREKISDRQEGGEERVAGGRKEGAKGLRRETGH